MDSKIKNRGSPVNASDFAINLCSDMSIPLNITYQLFWFSDDITRYLKKNVFFRASNGVIFGALAGFTYERVKMEGTTRVYLLGFDSNTSKDCFNQLRITCLSEEEKLATHKQVISALHELTDEVCHRNGSSYMVWPI
jgi:hypothetical protein